jgi:hypothetical protein
MLFKMINRAIAIVALFVCAGAAAQDEPQPKSSCSQKLKEMQKSYELGVLAPIPDALKECMSGGFTKTEKLQGYRLIILTYLFLDETRKAEQFMNELLNYEPDYVPNRALDPIEYIQLYESFNVLPFISFGVGLGANQTSAKLVNSYSVGNSETAPTSYQSGINFNFGASVDLLLVKKLYISAEGYVFLRSFSSTTDVLPRSRLSTEESHTAINVPFTIKYIIGTGKLKPYLRAGAAVDLLLSSQSLMVRTNTTTNQNDFAGPSLDMSPQRNALNLYLVGGVGMGYKLGYGYLFVDARYLYGMSNFSKVEGRYSDFEEKITQYGYIDNDFGLNNIQASIGYMMSMYKVKKKKQKLDLE